MLSFFNKNIVQSVIILVIISSSIIVYFVPEKNILLIVLISFFSALFIFTFIFVKINWSKFFRYVKTDKDKYVSIKTIRDILRLEYVDFKGFTEKILKFHGYKIFKMHNVGDKEIIIHSYKNNEHIFSIVYQWSVNRLVKQDDIDRLMNKYKDNKQTKVIIITTSDFEEESVDKNNFNNNITFINGSLFEKMLSQKKPEDPFS